MEDIKYELVKNIVEINKVFLNIKSKINIKKCDKKFFKSKTNNFCVSIDDETNEAILYYNKNLSLNSEDLFFSVCHEMRHIYQLENNLFDFAKYKQIKECKNIKEYNMQKEEVDANAYGLLIMDILFGYVPSYPFLGDKDIDDITMKRIEEIDDSIFAFDQSKIVLLASLFRKRLELQDRL